MNNKDQDFGFASKEFTSTNKVIPYCQFINADQNNFGLAITSNNIEISEFELSENWEVIDYEFSDGKVDSLVINKDPNLVVINRSETFMSNSMGEVFTYNKNQFNQGDFKAFSYAVIWFLDDNKKPLSKLPFRLKCSGYSGYTFNTKYDYYNNPKSFCKCFLSAYKNITNDRAINKNEIFYAHGIYKPNFMRKKAISRKNGQSSFTVLTESFIVPNKDNFPQLIVKNGSETSEKIKQFMVETESWIEFNNLNKNSQGSNDSKNHNLTDDSQDLHPEPIAF